MVTTAKIKPLGILRRLALEHAQRRYPNVPAHAIAVTRYNDKTANGLTKCIIDFIRLHGGQAERINSTGRILDNRKHYTDVVGFNRTVGSIQWIPGTGQKGTADVSATYNGVSLKIEVKIGRDQQSQAQVAYQRQIEMSGGVYYIAKDFESFYHWFTEKFQT